MWSDLNDLRAKFPLRQYRGGGGCANRHGHSNDFPSYCFWGYPSLDKFKGGVALLMRRAGAVGLVLKLIRLVWVEADS